jgi:hypothetical protein
MLVRQLVYKAHLMKLGIPASLSRDEFRLIISTLDGLEVIPMFGTLLGLHRDGDLIDNDDDIDFVADISHREEINSRLVENGYIIDEGIYPNITKYFTQAYKIISGFRILFDFYFWEKSEDNKELIIRWTRSAAQNREDDLYIPYDYIYPTNSKIYKDISLTYPADADACCKSFYGERWNEVLEKFLDYDYHFENHRPVIVYFDNDKKISARKKAIADLQNKLRIEKGKCEYLENAIRIITTDHENALSALKLAEHTGQSVTLNRVHAEASDGENHAPLSPHVRLLDLIDLLMRTLVSTRISQRAGACGALLTEDMLFALLRLALDKDWYLHSNPDVAAAGVDPFHHFLNHGYEEGRNPLPFRK